MLRNKFRQRGSCSAAFSQYASTKLPPGPALHRGRIISPAYRNAAPKRGYLPARRLSHAMTLPARRLSPLKPTDADSARPCMRPASLQLQTNRLGTATTGKIFSVQALPAAWHVTAVFCSSSEPRNPSTIHSGEAPKKKLVQVLALDRAMGILRPTQAGDACDGQVAEWLKAHAWNACIRATVSRVRIPLCPPFLFPRH